MKKLIALIILTIIIFTFIINKTIFTNNRFNDYITTNKESNIYDKNHSIIGKTKNNIYFELEQTKDNKYFKIKETDYYLYYKDINKAEKNIEENIKEYYKNLEKEITTNDETNFYKNNEIQFTINTPLTFNVKMQDDQYYYITYANQTYQIKKDEIKEEKEIKIDNISEYISVINYNSIEDSCNNLDCVTLENFKEQLNYLKENNFYTIDIEDYKNWLNKKINLKEKAILITSKQDINNIAQQFNFNVELNNEELIYIDSNSSSEQGNTTIPRYNIKNNTTIETFKKITNGEPITYIEKPILQTHTLPNENENASKIAVLNYHFFYDPEIGETCPDGNCKTVQDFEAELNYLKQNNYKTLTMEEFTKWMYNEIELPARSVLITIDDGAMGTGTHNGNKLIPLLEKYKAHATLFLISGWWPIGNYSSKYLDIESHTFDMHEGNYCENAQRGSKLLCSTREQVLEDLTKSVEITGSKNAFCFPMYVYNDTTLSVLKEIGFKTAFIGGDIKATRNDDKYKIPRYHIYRETTLDQFINMIS